MEGWPPSAAEPVRGRGRSMAFVIKAEVPDPRAKTFAARKRPCMAASNIARGDTVFVFASENEQDFVARGVVDSAEAMARIRGIARQTPRVQAQIRMF